MRHSVPDKGAQRGKVVSLYTHLQGSSGQDLAGDRRNALPQASDIKSSSERFLSLFHICNQFLNVKIIYLMICRFKDSLYHSSSRKYKYLIKKESGKNVSLCDVKKKAGLKRLNLRQAYCDVLGNHYMRRKWTVEGKMYDNGSRGSGSC